MKEIKLVRQKERSGCAAACIAMVLGKTYEEIAADFENDFVDSGIELEKTQDYLSDFGCRVIRKEIIYYGVDVKFGRDEILKPFAPVHIVRVKPKFDSEHGHLVVMGADGKLYCPDGDTDEEARNNYVITTVLGLYPQN